jgi:hypothetical protein
MNFVHRAGGVLIILGVVMLVGAGIARACTPEDGCTECETGMVSICFSAEAARDALEVSAGTIAMKPEVAQNHLNTASAQSDCAECQNYGGDSATRKTFCANYLASGICGH